MQSLRYAILHHMNTEESHFDLMFETNPGSMLATWRSEVWPIEFQTPLIRLRDHRRLYLEYEGVLSGDRGSVQRIAEGTCQVEVDENNKWTVQLIDGSIPTTLAIRQIIDEHWEAKPA